MISIDVSRVPAEKQTHPDFLRLKGEMEQALSHQKWIAAFCIHEAGHMTYLEELGAERFEYLGPQIVFSEGTGTFDGFIAAVKPETTTLPQKSDLQKYLSTAAKANVAGHVFAKSLTAAPDTGAEQDRRAFDDLCATIEGGYPGSVIDRQASWEQAEREVLEDLRSPQFRARAWAKARDIRSRIFGS